jgi:hypothetical protein
MIDSTLDVVVNALNTAATAMPMAAPSRPIPPPMAPQPDRTSPGPCTGVESHDGGRWDEALRGVASARRGGVDLELRFAEHQVVAGSRLERQVRTSEIYSVHKLPRATPAPASLPQRREVSVIRATSAQLRVEPQAVVLWRGFEARARMRGRRHSSW